MVNKHTKNLQQPCVGVHKTIFVLEKIVFLKKINILADGACQSPVWLSKNTKQAYIHIC